MLLATTDDIKKYISIDRNTDFSTIEPYIQEAEAAVSEYLGDTIYTALQGTLDETLEKLLPYVQRPIANYAYYLFIAGPGSVNISDIGIQVQRSQNSEPAPLWKVNKLEQSFLRAGDKHLDKMLEFLEKNIATYPDWINSGAYTELKENFLQNATQASKYININNSRRVFLQLKGFISWSEEVIIRALICSAQFDRLRAGLKADDLTAEEKSLVEKIKPIVAYYSLHNAIPQLQISITDQGISVSSFSDSINSKASATDKQIDKLRQSLKDSGQGYIDHLKAFIVENIEDYSLIENSDCYTGRADPGPSHQVDNSADSKSFWV